MRMTFTRRWRGVLVAVALAPIILLPALAFGGGPGAKTDDPARALLERSSRAMGEEKPWTTRVETGLQTVWQSGGWGTLKADYTRWIKKPDKLKIDQDNSAYDHPFFRMYYYNGGDAWYVVNLNPGRSPQVAASMKALVERADGIAYYLSACDTFFTVAVVPDDSLLAGASIKRAGCVLKGDTVLFDVDAKTGFLDRRIENKGKRAILFGDYRKTSGHMAPLRVTQYDEGVKGNEILWKTVSFNEKIDDAIFDENRPPQEKAPPK
jgi:hypothetical protein